MHREKTEIRDTDRETMHRDYSHSIVLGGFELMS